MTSKIATLAACAVALCVRAACAIDAYYVVCVTDMLGEKTYEVMDKDQLAAFKKQIALENRYFQKALSTVQKEWTSPERKDTHQFRWQGQKLKPRIARESPPYQVREKAVEKADKMTEKAMGLNAPGKKKKHTRLSEKEEEKLYQERLRHAELAEVAEAVKKEIESLATAAK